MSVIKVDLGYRYFSVILKVGSGFRTSVSEITDICGCNLVIMKFQIDLSQGSSNVY